MSNVAVPNTSIMMACKRNHSSYVTLNEDLRDCYSYSTVKLFMPCMLDSSSTRVETAMCF